MAELDLSIVERYADHLQRKASGRVSVFTIFFALVGSILGSVPLISLKYGLIPHHLGYATLLVGAAAGGYLGYTMGARRAEGLRLQAQLMLHQLQLGQSLVQVAAPVASVPLSYVPAAPAPAPALLFPPPPVLPATEPPLVAPEPAVSAAPPLSTPVQQLPLSPPAPPAPLVAPPAAQVPGPRLVDPAPAPAPLLTPGVTPATPPAMPPLSSSGT
jgi:hypothetical protein